MKLVFNHELCINGINAPILRNGDMKMHISGHNIFRFNIAELFLPEELITMITNHVIHKATFTEDLGESFLPFDKEHTYMERKGRLKIINYGNKELSKGGIILTEIELALLMI